MTSVIRMTVYGKYKIPGMEIVLIKFYRDNYNRMWRAAGAELADPLGKHLR